MRQRVSLMIILTIASSLNFAGIYILNLLWKVDIIYSSILLFLSGLINGILSKKIQESIIASYVSAILGAIIATIIIVGPVMIYSPEIIDLAITGAISCVGRILIICFVIITFSTLIGVFMSEY